MATVIIAQITDHLAAALDAARLGATGNQRWLNAIDAGASWLLEQDAVEFSEVAHELVFPSESGRVYHANGTCREATTGEPCKAWGNGNACRHRAAARLVRRALERQAEEGQGNGLPWCCGGQGCSTCGTSDPHDAPATVELPPSLADRLARARAIAAELFA